jgi:sigma-B regulation protein RsbU (phosphoserine phosphatase)
VTSKMAGGSGGLSPEKLRSILEVTRDLARPFDLSTMLYAVVDVAKELLDAEGGTVWQYHAGNNELEMRVARGLDAIRIPADRGIVGECVRTLAPINVPDCYADPRFNRDIDKASGQRTRCMLTLPLIGYDDLLVGVLQVVNRRDGVFDEDDEAVAAALAAQCAVALQRVQMTERLVLSEKLRQEILVAREIQTGTLPKETPVISGYDFAGLFQPADETGGDTYDFVSHADGSVFVLMGDATGHGIGPALSATQVRAMLRVALRLGADLDDVFRHINDQLVEDLSEDRFVTAFLGRLDPDAHELHYHSGGQGPLLHFRAADQSCEFHPPTTFPMGAIPLPTIRPVTVASLALGDVFALVSDGVYEYEDAESNQFGEQGVADVLRQYHDRPMPYLLGRLMDALADFGKGAPQLDDVTVVLIRRLPEPDPVLAGDLFDDNNANAAETRRARQSFPRSFDSLTAMFGFIQRALAGDSIGAEARYAIEFTYEELFTNMVKYNPDGSGELELVIERTATELICQLSDPDSHFFDVTAAPDADVNASAEQRNPGGLGLHLIRRLVDSVVYDYSGRRSLITFRKKLGSA